MHTHLFRCGASDSYCFSNDAAGANLPVDTCPGGWKHVRSIDFEGNALPWGIEVAWKEQEAAIRAGLSINGFFLADGRNLPPDMLTG